MTTSELVGSAAAEEEEGEKLLSRATCTDAMEIEKETKLDFSASSSARGDD
jgi:hypothetical protein